MLLWLFARFMIITLLAWLQQLQYNSLIKTLDYLPLSINFYARNQKKILSFIIEVT